MEFTFTCPNCKQPLLATEGHIDTEIDCPHCSFKSVVRRDPVSSTTPPPIEEPLGLTLDDLTTSKEKTYFGILITISLLGWLILAISMFGIFYAVLAGIGAWFASGLLAAHLKSESIQVTREQLPVLYRSLEEVCGKLKLPEIPEFYIVQHNGVLNAFATRHSGRNFVVIFSDLLEALGHDSPQIRFLIGHEIGHIRRNHLLKRLMLIPSMIIPLIGKAYHRACEASCDRFGLFAAGNTRGATLGLLVLAGGREAAPLADPAAFARQHHHRRGFFVSWHELASGYPTLSQRVSNILAVRNPEFARKAGRNPLAYLFAPIFTFQTLIIIYIVAVFGALALPAFNKAYQKGKETQQRNRTHSQLRSN
jgi:Zn-dependent protease with chaperone function/DNA-directed RNA polymerase subunit RPC12/RpoP